MFLVMNNIIKIGDILVSGDQNWFGNIRSGIRVIEVCEGGIRVSRIHYSTNEIFFISSNNLTSSLWKPLELNRQLPLF